MNPLNFIVTTAGIRMQKNLLEKIDLNQYQWTRVLQYQIYCASKEEKIYFKREIKGCRISILRFLFSEFPCTLGDNHNKTTKLVSVDFVHQCQ